MAATTAPTIAMIAEAGSREAPALPPGLLTETCGEAGVRPTKLFIGGISRHTTTKQLRDHFSMFGRVLDCVAMRQPDGRPRGFGYVTLDSPTAADRCLREPQMIDNRIVDMKLAVPEGSCSSGGTSPKEAGFTPRMFPAQADYMGMFGGGYGGWPDTSGAFCNPSLMWGSGKTGQGLDCADLLTAARDLAISHAQPPSGLLLQSVGPYGDFAASDPLDTLGALYGTRDEGQAQPTLIPEEFQQPPGAVTMSANAPEFVPGKQAAAVETSANPVGAAPPAQTQKPRGRAPLGELTNIVVEVGDLLKPFESPTNKLAGMGHGHLSNAGNRGETTDNRPATGMRTIGLLLDDEANSSSPSSSSDSHLVQATSPDSSSPEPESASPPVDTCAAAEACNELEDDKGPVSPVSSNASESGEDSSGDGEAVVVDLDSLPSMGSAQHATGECKRCNFFPKGRCQNGKNCTFCHYPHDKRKPSRQEKRERRAAWLDCQQEEPLPHGLHEDVIQHASGALLSNPILQQGCFGVFADEDIYSQETLAYSIFPGLPPIHATKLPAPLPLPGMDNFGMDMSCRSGPALPPGLAPPAMATRPWQSEADVSPAAAAQSILSTGLTMPAGVFDQNCVQQVVSSTTRTGPLGTTPLATVPTPLRTTPASSLASTPMPTPLPTPTASTGMNAEALSFMPAGMTTASGTQTGDYRCNKCVEKLQESDSTTEDSKARQGQQWSREELLRLRDGLVKVSEVGKARILPHTAAITAIQSV